MMRTKKSIPFAEVKPEFFIYGHEVLMMAFQPLPHSPDSATNPPQCNELKGPLDLGSQ